MMTKNEEDSLPRSLPPLITNFAQVFVVDSNSTDQTQTIAKNLGAQVVNFTWNGQYPKKKQWCIDNLPLNHDWVFLCDADEIITDTFIHEMRHLDYTADGYFVRSSMIWNGRLLKYGQKNNKLCLFHKDRFHHPAVDDLTINGGWEVEGHYQPVSTLPKPKIGQIKSALMHYDTANEWVERHKRYITWEVGMIRDKAFPRDPVKWRENLKTFTRTSCLRPSLYFIYGYIFKLGFLDGRAGLDYALKRFWYNASIIRALNNARHTCLDQGETRNTQSHSS
jgi:glycosyltransferase involved in cell wall biosynthesis